MIESRCEEALREAGVGESFAENAPRKRLLERAQRGVPRVSEKGRCEISEKELRRGAD